MTMSYDQPSLFAAALTECPLNKQSEKLTSEAALTAHPGSRQSEKLTRKTRCPIG